MCFLSPARWWWCPREWHWKIFRRFSTKPFRWRDLYMFSFFCGRVRHQRETNCKQISTRRTRVWNDKLVDERLTNWSMQNFGRTEGKQQNRKKHGKAICIPLVNRCYPFHCHDDVRNWYIFLFNSLNTYWIRLFTFEREWLNRRRDSTFSRYVGDLFTSFRKISTSTMGRFVFGDERLFTSKSDEMWWWQYVWMLQFDH